MGPILAVDHTFTRQEHMKPMLCCHWDLFQHKSGCHHHQIGMDYLYAFIFKMAASEVKLRFRILLSI